MSALWGYSDLYDLIEQRPNLKRGIVVDTNILVAATYELDENYDASKEFLDLVFEKKIPLYCNVNVRTEFLEIHRRIIFSEAILDFAEAVDISKLPTTLAEKVTNLRKRQGKLERKMKLDPAISQKPIRLSEAEIKDIKMEMLRLSNASNENLWYELCESRVGSQLSSIWDGTLEDFGLNFLSTREGDETGHLHSTPNWDNVTALMENQGLASSDAMIVNIFLCSKFELLLTSDNEVAIAVTKNCKPPQGVIVPEKVKSAIEGT